MNAIQSKPSLAKAIRAFHEDEDGLEAMQVVIIVALAAVILLWVMKTWWPDIRDWAKGNTDELKGIQP